jgi:CHAT domain-containing protein
LNTGHKLIVAASAALAAPAASAACSHDELRCGGLVRGFLLAVLGISLFVGAPNARSSESLTELEMVGRYAELAKVAAERLRNKARPSTSVLAPLCLAYSRLKWYNKLLPCLDELEKQIQSGDTTIETDKSLISNSDASPFANMLRSEALLELGNYQEAIAEAKIAIARVHDRLPYGVWPPTRYRLGNLGTLSLAYALAGDQDNARTQLRLLEDFSIGFMGSSMFRPFRANAVARAYMALGEYQKALPYVRQDEGAWIRTTWFLGNASWGLSGEDAVETFLVLPKLLIRGKCLSEIGDIGAAKTSLDAALRNARIQDYAELYWIALFERGRIAEKEGSADEAIEYYKRAVKVIEQQRSTINTETNKIGFVGDKQAVYHGIIGSLFAAKRYPEAFDYVERSKSRALVDMLAKQEDFAAPAVDERKIRDLLAQASQAEINAASPIHAEAESGSALRGNRTSVLTRQSIAEAVPELGSLISVSSIPIQDIQARLPENEALIEYHSSNRSLFAFVLTRQTLQGIRLDAGGLEDDVRALRKAIEQYWSDAYLGPAQRLYARLISPLESFAREKKLVIVPHGPLHYLPFAVLHDGSQFLIDKYSLRFLPSASVMKYIRATKLARPSGILAFGNPDRGDPKYDLQFAQEEAVGVAQTVPQSRALLRKEATESALRQYAAGFRYLHFATHGKFDAQSPLQSALLLSSDASSDGLLNVGKLYSMRLDADLVTLSACETGLGKVASGDDVIGLTRGFLYAGASSIVASLWQVDDRATADLMIRFYNNLRDQDKRDALRQAQIATRQKFPHPFFWAAFQLTGSSF